MNNGFGIFGGLIGLGLLALAIMWLVLPVIVLSKFNELLKIQREMLKLHREMQNRSFEPLDESKPVWSEAPPTLPKLPKPVSLPRK